MEREWWGGSAEDRALLEGGAAGVGIVSQGVWSLVVLGKGSSMNYLEQLAEDRKFLLEQECECASCGKTLDAVYCAEGSVLAVCPSGCGLEVPVSKLRKQVRWKTTLLDMADEAMEEDLELGLILSFISTGLGTPEATKVLADLIAILVREKFPHLLEQNNG